MGWRNVRFVGSLCLIFLDFGPMREEDLNEEGGGSWCYNWNGNINTIINLL